MSIVCYLCLSRLQMSMSIVCYLCLSRLQMSMSMSEQTRDIYVQCVLVVSEQTTYVYVPLRPWLDIPDIIPALDNIFSSKHFSSVNWDNEVFVNQNDYWRKLWCATSCRVDWRICAEVSDVHNASIFMYVSQEAYSSKTPVHIHPHRRWRLCIFTDTNSKTPIFHVD